MTARIKIQKKVCSVQCQGWRVSDAPIIMITLIRALASNAKSLGFEAGTFPLI
jgi:hypothetical protein